MGRANKIKILEAAGYSCFGDGFSVYGESGVHCWRARMAATFVNAMVGMMQDSTVPLADPLSISIQAQTI